jgi:MFS superfamily sulfate permease-like transporter
MAALTADRTSAVGASLLLWAMPRLRLDALLRRVPVGVTRGMISGAGIVIVLGFLREALSTAPSPPPPPGALTPGMTAAAFLLVMALEAHGTLGDRFAPRRDLRAVGVGSLASAALIGVPATAAAARSRPISRAGTGALVVNVVLTLALIPFLPAIWAATPPVVLSGLLLPSAFLLIVASTHLDEPVGSVIWAVTATTVAIGGFVVGIAVGIVADVLLRCAVARVGVLRDLTAAALQPSAAQ